MKRTHSPIRPALALTRQRGAALLMAMIIVTVVSTLAAGMVWQQWRAIQVEAAERAQTQAQWILQGALDWTRMILREDARSSNIDHLGEPWAAPLAEARLSTFLAADRSMAEDAPDAFLSGRIEDAQSRYNLRNLIGPDPKGGNKTIVTPDEMKKLERLCNYIGLSPDIASRLAEAVRRATPGGNTEVTTSDNPGDSLPLMPITVDDLGWLGLETSVIKRLKPYVVVLPEATSVNVNTASKEVIAAVLQNVDLASAERLIQFRQRSPLKSLDDIKTVLGANSVPSTHISLGVGTHYFFVYGALRLENVTIAQRSLLRRQGNNAPQVLMTQRLRDLSELEATLKQ